MFTLDNPACIPSSVLASLAENHRIIKRVRYFSQLLEHPEMRSAAEQLNRLITASHVRGFHCAKELAPGLIKSRGLRVLSIDQHLDEFLAFVRTNAPQLSEQFERVYRAWRVDRQMEGREGRVSFCLSRDLVIEDGTERFFKYYGGEALYWPFERGNPCLAFLESLGRPVVVEAALPADELTTFIELPFARTLLGHFARRVNAEFQVEPLEAQMTRSVEPSEIVAIHEKDAFFRDALAATV